MFKTEPEYEYWDRNPRMPSPPPPPGSCDCQFHIYADPDDYPTRPNPPYEAIDATFEDARAMHRAIGFDYGVIVHSGHLMDAAAVAAGKNLRVIGRAGVGIDNIDVEAATAAGVLVMNLPWGNTVTAAEHTIALMLALARNVPQASSALRAGTWDRKPYLGVELKDKTIGVVGFGRIGREVARRAQAMEMKVLAHDPYMSEKVAADLGIELIGLDELLPRVDVLTVHVPLSKETHQSIAPASPSPAWHRLNDRLQLFAAAQRKQKSRFSLVR